MSELLSKKDIYKLLLLVRKLTRRLRCTTEDAEEIGQDVMLKILTSKSVPPTFTEAWLRLVVKNAAFDLFRDLQLEKQWVDRSLHVSGASTVEEGCADYVAAILVDYDQMIELGQLRTTIDLLPIKEKQVLILYAEGYAYSEIAELTGAKLGTVRSRLHSARAKVRDLLACA